jgi:WD40 repeat protein/serine/threonine protein kinase/tetratricopeptide (TPR) repeat protein
MSPPTPTPGSSSDFDSGRDPQRSPVSTEPPRVPDHEMIRIIGRGSYGTVWLSRNIMGTYRAVKVIYRDVFDHDRPYEREFEGIQRFEPVSRTHDCHLDILHIGRSESGGYFYYVMELADDASTLADAPYNLASPQPGETSPKDTSAQNSPEPTSHSDPLPSPASGRNRAEGASTEGELGSSDRYQPRTLRRELHRRGPLPVAECVELGLALSTALVHLHRHGLVHRDIKPSNIVYVNGQPKLADIGLISHVDATLSHVGTLGFAPPEGPGTPQGDIYSLGKVLYEAVTGRDRQEFPELPTRITGTEEQQAELFELNEVLLKACEGDPRHRYRTAAEMHEDLLALRSGKSLVRLRTVEKRLTFARRAGAVTGILLLLAAGAYGYQSRQTRIVEELAVHNLELARESRDLLVRMQVATGNRLVEAGDYSEALLWFTEALELIEDDPHREEVHRVRLDSVLRHIPRVVQLFQHDAGVLWCEFSPDRRHVASASRDHTARVWDLATGELAAPPFRHTDRVRSVRFSPDGRWVLTASADKTARVWEVTTGEPVSPPLEHLEGVWSAVFSPDGTQVLTHSRNGPAIIWDPFTGQPVGEAMNGADGGGGTLSAAFSPDGQRVVTANTDGTVTVWDANRRSPLFPPLTTLRLGGEATFVAFSPEGNRILTGTGSFMYAVPWPEIARLWCAATGIPSSPEMVHSAALSAGHFSPDGRQILTVERSRGRPGVARVWDTETGSVVGSEIHHGNEIWRAAFDPDGLRIAICASTTVSVWDAASGKRLAPPLHHAHQVNYLAFQPDSDYLATASEDHLVRVWDLAGAGGADRIVAHDEVYYYDEIAVTQAEFGQDGQTLLTILAGRGQGSARIYDAVEWEPITPEMTHSSQVGTADRSADGMKIAMAAGPFLGAPGTNVSVWNAMTGELLFEAINESQVKFVAFSPDSQYLLVTSQGYTARVLDSATGDPVSPTLRHDGIVSHGSFSPDGKQVVTASEDRTAQIWEWASGRQVFGPLRHDRAVNSAEYSPDGGRIVTAAEDGTIRLWDALTGQPLTLPLRVGDMAAPGATFSPDGQSILGWGDRGIARVWDAETGQSLVAPLQHGGRVMWAEFSPDGRYIGTASLDRSARVWDAATGEAVSIPLRHEGVLFGIRFHPQSDRLVTSSYAGGARIWKLRQAAWPAEDITRLAILLTGCEIDPMLSRSALPAERIVAAFHELRDKYPDEFPPQPDHWLEWHRNRALEARLEHRWAAGLHHLNRLVAHYPEEARLYEERGDVRAELEQWELAYQDFARAVELHSDGRLLSPFLLASLKAGDQDGARKHAARLVEHATQSEDWSPKRTAAFGTASVPDLLPDYSTTLAWAQEQPDHDGGLTLIVQLYRAGRYHDAIQVIHEYDQLSRFVPLASYYYAMALHRVGENESAHEAFEIAERKFEHYARRRIVEKLPWYHLAYCECVREEARALLEDGPTP